MDQHLSNKKTSSGYVMLISMIIVGAVSTSVVISSIFIGIGSSKNAITTEQSHKARLMADACVEEALIRIWNSDSFEGNGNINFADGSCSYSVVGSSIPKSIDTNGTVGNVVRKNSATLSQLHPYIVLSDWSEIP